MKWFNYLTGCYSDECVCDDDCGVAGSSCDDRDTCDDYCSAD